MNPVIGLDVSKGESQIQAFRDRGKPYCKSFSIKHTREGLSDFGDFLKRLEDDTGSKPAVVLESTGHYHTPIIQFLEEYQYLYILINPILSYQAKRSSLRKVKTDAIDAYLLGELYYKEELKPYKIRGIQLLNLRNLTRQHETITGLYVQAKLQFHAILDQVFPEYRGVFGDLFSKVSLQTLKEYKTSETILKAGLEKLEATIKALCKSRSKNWAKEKAKELLEAANRNPFRINVYQSHLVSLDMYIGILLQYKGYLTDLENQIDILAGELEEYEIIQSIPGIGEKIAATIISEIGEIDRFDHPKKLVAFSGIDPSVHSSGQFTATQNKITKRGSSRLRHALYLAVRCGIRSSRNKRLREFYDKKRKEGKLYNVAIIACANKLIHWIYALLKRKETFQDLS